MSKIGELIVTLKVDPSEYSKNLDKGGQAAQQFGQTASGHFAKAEMSAKQMQFAMRGVPAQFTDIVTSLQGGQKPLTVLLQQGGQLRDMFGGIGPAAKAMGSYIAGMAPMVVHPLTLIAAGVTAIGFAAYQSRQQIQDLNREIIATGGISGMSATQMAELADKVGEQTKKYGEAREAVQLLSATGQLSSSQMEIALRGVVNGATVTGKSVKDMVEEFSAISKDPVEAIVKLNDKYNFLTLSVFENIQALAEQGKKQEAATAAFEAFAKAMDDRAPQIKENLGSIESLWGKIKGSIAGAAAELMKWGRAETLAEERKRVAANLEGMEKSGNADLAAYIANSKARLKQIDEEIAAEKKAADTKGETARANKANVEAAEFRKKYLDSSKHQTLATALEKENEEFSRAVVGLEKGSAKYQEVFEGHLRNVDKIKKRYAPKGEKTDPFNAEFTSMERTAAGMEFVIANFDRFAAGARTSKEAMAEFDVTLGKFSDEARRKAALPVLTPEQKAEYIAEGKLLDDLAERERKLNVIRQFGKDVREFAFDQRQYAAGIEFEIAMLGRSRIEVEKLTALRRIDFQVQEMIRRETEKLGPNGLSGLSEEEVKRHQDLIAALYAEAEAAKAATALLLQIRYDAARDPWVGLMESMNRYRDEATNSGKQIGDMFTNAMHSAEDAWVKFAQTGKLSFKELANSVIADMARMPFKQMMSGSGGAGGMGLIGLVGSIFGAMAGGDTSSGPGSLGGTGANAASWLGDTSGVRFGGFRAAGGPVEAGKAYIVGEDGPEPFIPSTSGTIIPNGALGGTTIHYAPVFQIDSRADRAAVREDMERIAQRSNAELVDKLQRQGRL